MGKVVLFGATGLVGAYTAIYLKENGYLAFEIGYNQGSKIKNMLYENKFKDINIIKDYSHLDRIITARNNKGEM